MTSLLIALLVASVLLATAPAQPAEVQEAPGRGGAQVTLALTFHEDGFPAGLTSGAFLSSGCEKVRWRPRLVVETE